MNDNLLDKIAQAASNGPDMSAVPRPSHGALFAENKKLETTLACAHPGKLIKVLDKATFKPTDICVRFADLLVDNNTHTLRPDVLKLSASKLSTAMVKQHGSRYAISDKWQSQERPMVAKKSLAISIVKVLDRLNRLRKYLAPKSPKRSVQTLLVKTPQL